MPWACALQYSPLTRLRLLQIKRWWWRWWRWRWWRWWWRMLRFSPEISSRSVDTPGAGAGAASLHLSSKLSSLSGRGRQNVLVSLFFHHLFMSFRQTSFFLNSCLLFIICVCWWSKSLVFMFVYLRCSMYATKLMLGDGKKYT